MKKHIIIAFMGSLISTLVHAEIIIRSLQNELPSAAFVTLTTTDPINNQQTSSQFTINAESSSSKQIRLKKIGQTSTIQLSSPDARWKTATIKLSGAEYVKDPRTPQATYTIQVSIDGIAQPKPTVIVDNIRTNEIKSSQLTLHITQDGIAIKS